MKQNLPSKNILALKKQQCQNEINDPGIHKGNCQNDSSKAILKSLSQEGTRHMVAPIKQKARVKNQRSP